MKRPLNIRFIVIASVIGTLAILVGAGVRAYYLSVFDLKNAKIHADEAFQGKPVIARISCVGFWQENLPAGTGFKLYMESSNGKVIDPLGYNCVAVKTSDGRRYELIEPFDYLKARAYGDDATEFISISNNTNSMIEKRASIQDRIKSFSDNHYPQAAKILKLRLVSSLDELDTLLSELGFKKQ
jgi:hypothetical protein